MRKWYRLTALVLAFAIVLSTVSGALAQVEVDYSEYLRWVEDVKAANGLAGVISIDEGGEVLVEPSTFTGATNVGPQYTTETTQNLGTYAADSAPTIDVALEQYGKVTLAAPAGGQWQAYLAAADLWVNITGETGSTFELTFAKVQSLFMANGHAQLRCKMGDAVTETVNVGISYSLTALPASTQEESAVLMRANSTGNDGIALAAETPELKEYSVVINYVFTNNEVAADPYTATLAKGSNFSTTVKNPTVVGYLPYLNDEQSENVVISISNIQEDVTYTVTYKPTNVNYKVIHYQQNVDNDNYSIVETETLQDLTGNTVGEVAKSYDGFYALLYQKPTIAADGSTVVEIYYDRNYYLMNFDMDGGYGTEPIYARFGAEIKDVIDPTKAGYSFKGWAETKDSETAVALPATMPAGNVTYYAIWEADKKAKVSIVFWGENADDEEYSYLSTTEMELESGKQYIYGNATLTCTKEAHKHIDSCLECTKVEHAHSESCYLLTCTTQVHTTHTSSCYPGAAASTSDLGGWAPGNPEEGKVYEVWWENYIYINGNWYKYSGSTSAGSVASTNCTIHEHTDYTGTCYTMNCTIAEHTHISSCFKCGKTEHKHGAACFDNDPAYPIESERHLWTFAGSDVVTVAPDGSTVVNVYYDRTSFTLTFNYYGTVVKTIKEKWGADIHDEFPIKTSNGTETIWWKVPNNCTSLKPGTGFGSLDTMLAENVTFTRYGEAKQATLHYYVEVLPGEEGTYPQGGKNFKLYKDINITTSGHLTYTEEFHDIIGFKQWWSDPAFNKHEQGGVTNGINTHNYLCYSRNRFDIVYFNPTTQLKVDENVPYEMPLTTYYWEPDPAKAPAQYEPGSVKFEGWYLNPECTGEKFDFAKQTMPAGPNNVDGEVALSLYAKWVPVTHTVRFYLDKAAYEADSEEQDTELASHPPIEVEHGKLADPEPADPTNGGYAFVGWFYMDGDVEKAFDFANIPITEDMQVYGKWSSNVLKEYVVLFKIQGTDTEIADRITGSDRAGLTKTFDAKGGTDLYDGYQEGFFPLVKSHSMNLEINTPSSLEGIEEGWIEISDGESTKIVQSFTFYYVKKDAVPYTVYYVTEEQNESGSLTPIVLDGKTYYIVAETYTNSENRQAVVTEKFKVVPGYMPDAYQKRLVVDGTEGADNKIIFVYSVDTAHAYYKITHYTENLDGETWTEYASSQAVGEIGEPYSAEELTIDGFTFDAEVEGTVQSGTLTAEGLELKLYYVRNSYPYLVRYLEQNTMKQLAEPKNGTGLYGEVISESAIDIAGYEASDPTSQTLNIRIEESETEPELNIITFYYTENDATINYVVVGPTGCGTVQPTTETVKAVIGYAEGSTASVSSSTYKFVGWFKDESCNQPVNADWVDENDKIVPEQPGRVTTDDGVTNGLWPETTTYYAKFVEEQVTINYVPVGPEGLNEDGTPKATAAGTVSLPTEKIDIISGPAAGSTAKANAPTYKFVGWFKDAACTQAITEADWVNANVITPKPQDTDSNDETPAVYAAATYYAKFDWNVADLTIVKTGLDEDTTPQSSSPEYSDNESAIFTVVGDYDGDGDVDTFTVIIPCKEGSGQKTLTGICVGKYTVTELTDWTWRYDTTTYNINGGTEATGYVAEVNVEGGVTTTVTFTNDGHNGKWLGGDNYTVNTFSK